MTLVTPRYTRSLRTPPLSDAPLEGLVSAVVAKSLAITSHSPRPTHMVMPNRCIRSLGRIGSDEPLRDAVRSKKRGEREGKGKAAPPARLCVCHRPTVSFENTETALRRSSSFPFPRGPFAKPRSRPRFGKNEREVRALPPPIRSIFSPSGSPKGQLNRLPIRRYKSLRSTPSTAVGRSTPTADVNVKRIATPHQSSSDRSGA